ncbi:unnamed protein product [Ectocarpus sp. 4 AP-2014]
MASQAEPDLNKHAATPSKARPCPGDGPATPMDISSPEPVLFSLQKLPPLLSSKPRSGRKVSSLFSDGTARARSGGVSAKKEACGSSDVPAAPGAGVVDSIGEDRHQAATAAAAANPQTEAWDGTQIGGGVASFASPVRASRDAADGSRYTPQRNLGGLFASPLPPPRDASRSTGGMPSSADLALELAPPLAQRPKREERAAVLSVSCPPAEKAVPSTPPPPAQKRAEATGEGLAVKFPAPEMHLSPTPEAAQTAAERSPVPEKPATPVKSSPVAAKPSPVAVRAPATPVAPAADARVPASCRCGCSSSETSGTAVGTGCDDDLCCVSNDAFKSGEAMRTLEVLVKRERVGVNALASWRVAELKRRLVHLKFFPAAEAIALVPTIPLGGEALGDDVRLDTLDDDVTYKARPRPVAAVAAAAAVV